MRIRTGSVPLGFMWRRWIYVFALGFGTGLIRWMPGTMGALVGIPLAYGLASMPWLWALCVLVFLTGWGIWICGEAADALGEHDHSAIVWDEVIGYAWVMVFFPWSWLNALCAFMAFRFFDILKPWPISWCDQHVDGGLGIMVDDVLAAAFSCLLIYLFLWLR
jgi:phosphatidylglycerophosphatase A